MLLDMFILRSLEKVVYKSKSKRLIGRLREEYSVLAEPLLPPRCVSDHLTD